MIGQNYELFHNLHGLVDFCMNYTIAELRNPGGTVIARVLRGLSVGVCVCFQGQLVSVWQDLSQSELSLNQQLAELYDTLLSTWHSQLQWSSQVCSHRCCLIP